MRGGLMAVALAGLLAAAGPASGVAAQALPTWPIAEICAKEGTPGQCAAFEGRARNAVSSSWAFVLDPIKQACLAQLKTPADQSWRLLAECIDNETLKALNKAAVHTARTPAEPVPPPRPPMPPLAADAVPPAAPAAPPPVTEPPKAQ